MLDFSLDQLFPSLGHHEFLENYLKDVPTIEHNHPFVKTLKEIPYLNLENLFKQWPAQVNAYQKGTADEVNSIAISPNEAMELYQREGSGLFFDDPSRFVPELNHYLEQLRNELGLSQMTYCRSLIYLIAKGKGTSAHFDQNINFIFQITGTKKWWIAPNHTVANPLERYTIGHEAGPELASYTHEEFPTEFPKGDAIEIELKPGSLLFLPRGVWHKTYADEEALSLNFTFTAPSYADLMLAALRSRLIQSPQWRETVQFLGNPELEHHSLALFDELIKDLAADSKTWRAQDILGATES